MTIKKLKDTIVQKYKDLGNDVCLIKDGISYTGNDISEEVRSGSLFGNDVINSIIETTIESVRTKKEKLKFVDDDNKDFRNIVIEKPIRNQKILCISSSGANILEGVYRNTTDTLGWCQLGDGSVVSFNEWLPNINK